LSPNNGFLQNRLTQFFDGNWCESNNNFDVIGCILATFIHTMHQQLPMNGVVNYNTPQKQ
jgi:hypothetical protein